MSPTLIVPSFKSGSLRYRTVRQRTPPIFLTQAITLSLLAQGYSYKEIAETMSISLTTVNNYIRRIYEKLHVQSRGQAVAIYANLIEKRD